MKKLVASINSPGRLTVLAALLAGLCAPAMAASDVVISQVYGGGGNANAPINRDYIELFNRGAAAVDISGWSVQYASSAGTSWSNKTVLGSVVLQPGQYFLIGEAIGAVGSAPVTPDASGAIAMSASAGKVALVSDGTTIGALANPVGAPGVIDVVSFGGSTPTEGSPTAVLSNTTAALRKSAGCTDNDTNSADFTVGAPAPRNSSTIAACGGGTPAAPIVITTCPVSFGFEAGTASFAGLVASDADSIVNGVSITSAPVAGISLTAFTPAGAVGGNATVNLSIDASVPSGNYPVAITFTNGDAQTKTCTVAVKGAGTHTIPQIQGAGAASPYVDTIQTTEGVITMKLVPNGFFIQDLAGDGDPTTSDALYVFGGTTTAVVGDLVRVKGTIAEYKPSGADRSYTEMKDTISVEKLGGGYAIAPTNIVLPGDGLARVEGMLVRFSNPLIINHVNNLGDRGEMTLASVRREVPTNRYPAGSAGALALAAANAADQIVLDDGMFTQSATIPFINPADSTVRVGDTVTDLVGVVDYGSIGNSNYGFKLQPMSVPSVTISRTNPRTTAPVVAAGNVKVASANVLNFFTTFTNGTNVLGATGQGCTEGATTNKGNCRGANNLAEYIRQRDKIVNELKAIDADVVGLMEIQNNGTTAVSDLVNSLNAEIGSPVYDYVPNPPSTGTDAIRVAMIYKPGSVSRVGLPMSDNNTLNNRHPLAQTFKAANGARFSVIVNHLKSKSSCGTATGNNVDKGDGQGCWNASRVLQAQRLLNDFIPAVQAAAGDADVLVIGDLNSHGFEDPINVLTGAGMVNELERFVRPNGIVYSYVFDGESGYLDHALATASLDSQMAGATEWHNNADEPGVIDYNNDVDANGVPIKPQDLYINNAYRASDHDPVVVSLNLTPTFVDSTASFTILRNGLAVNRVTGKYTGTLSFTNKTGSSINGPFQVLFDGLTAGVTLDNKSGGQGAYPYLTVNNGSIAPGATVTVSMTFSNPSKVAVGYTPKIITGTF